MQIRVGPLAFSVTQAPEGPVFHLCRWNVAAPRPPTEMAWVRHPRSDPAAPGALAVEGLLLPEGWAVSVRTVLPRDLPVAAPLWMEDSDTPLLVPSSVVRDRRVDREWRSAVFVTPTSIGVPGDADVFSRIAWAVLCRCDHEALIAALAQLARQADRYRDDPVVNGHLVAQMRSQPSIANPLTAAARGGDIIFNPRCILWIIRELAAASDAERAAHAEWRPTPFDDDYLVAAAFLPCLLRNTEIERSDVLLAAWMLHEAFWSGGDDGSEEAERLMSLTAVLGYRFGNGRSWLQALGRSRQIWGIGDDHPAVGDAAVSPSELRERYATVLGIDVSSWLSGVWAVCMRWWSQMEGALQPDSDPSDVFVLPLESGRIELSDEFRASFRTHLVGDMDAFAQATRREANSAYAGLGSLPQGESLACRDMPVLRLSDGSLHPLGIDLVADRVATLHSWLFRESRGEEASSYGRMFEAYVADRLGELSPRHVVVTEDQITSVLGETTRCDALVVDDGACLAVETSVQGLPWAVARGDLAALRRMAGQYQRKAGQAMETLRQWPFLAAHLGLPSRGRRCHLLVTETPVPHSPVFLRALHSRRPGATPKFVCGVADLELLVDLGRAGWSVPTAVANWQGEPGEVALQVKLLEMARTLRPSVAGGPSVDDWLGDLPLR